MLPVVVLTAHFVGNRFSKNVYDVLMGEWSALLMWLLCIDFHCALLSFMFATDKCGVIVDRVDMSFIGWIIMNNHIFSAHFLEASGGPYMDDLPDALYTVPVCNVMMPIVEHHVSCGSP